MGDAGSNFLGFLLGSLTVVGTFTNKDYSPYSVLAPLLVMAVPLYDMTSVVLIRLREGRSPFKGDRCHFFAPAGSARLDSAAGGLDD